MALKKIIVILLSVVVLFAFTACEKKRNDNLSDRMYEYGVAAYEIIDDYFSGKLSSTEATDKLQYNYSLQEMHYDSELREYNKDSLVGTPAARDSLVTSATLRAYHKMKYKSQGSGTDADIREAQDDLKKVLWK